MKVRLKLKAKIFLTIIFLMIVFSLIYLYAVKIGAKVFVIKEYKIENENISEGYNNLKIIHMSDIHYGISINKKELEKIVEDINKLEPDIIFFTGDLVDDSIDSNTHKEIVEVLSNLEANIGKYAVNGNHDYHYKNWNNLIIECGFTDLNDTYDLIYKNSYNPIFIAGISDNIYSKKKIEDKSKTIFDFLNSEASQNNVFNILLMHEPDYIDDIDYNKFNLILSGHSHNGQVRLPIIGSLYTPEGSKKYHEEYYKLNNTDLYISSGIGTTLLPIRLFNRPSINFYRIIKKEN